MYDAQENEKKTRAFWESSAIFKKLEEKNKKGKKFYFCDGPPYATGQIHPGTAWNKCIKDTVCRYKRARGFNLRAQPGYDTHGLPIEVKVEKEMNLTSKKEIEKVGIEEFITRCKKFATQYINIMSEQFSKLGVWMQFEKPYVTYKDEFIESSWKTIKKAHEKGLLEEGVYVLPFCPRCETTIANYELEYDDKEDPSIYVKFKSMRNPNEYLVIWTTTPWTLVSNIAVMAHPMFKYVRVKVDEETWILAKDRLEAVSAICLDLGKSFVVLEEFSGIKLKDLEYEHPLVEHIPYQKKLHKIIMTDRFVTLDEGSGLVHCAPGHGPSDFIVGKQNNLDIFCPVDTRGNYGQEGGKYAGMNVREANPLIIEDLKEKGLLLNAGKITHRYPHCWRCKTPLIFITTKQWFITITKVKERMLEEINNATWNPDFARVWFTDFVSSAPDWCISRQRYWGIPLPIWVCEKCKKIKVIGSKEELQVKLPELHKPYIDGVEFECACGGKMKRTPDVLDVWFDSGNAIWASLEKGEEQWYPCDFIVEGKDQIRGWFYSLLGSGVVLNNEIPYKSLLMHGFFVNEKGEPMSKSLGNFVPLEEMLEKHGADAFRLWSLGNAVWDDLKFSWDELAEANRALQIMWNVYLLYGRFYKEPAKSAKISYSIEDLWLLSRLGTITKECTESLETYNVHTATRALKTFIIEDLSRFYLKLAKKRLAENDKADAVHSALHTTLFQLLKLSSPLIPFISEELYQMYFRASNSEESLSLFPWPSAEAHESRIDPILEKQMIIAREVASAVANARQEADVKLRWPLESALVVTSSTESAEAVKKLHTLIESTSNVKEVKLGENSLKVAEINPLPGKLGPKFKKDANLVADALRKLNSQEIGLLKSEGKITITLESAKHEISKDMVEFKEKLIEGYAEGKFSEGSVFLKTEMNEALYGEAMAREVGRRIQETRKQMNLVESDAIRANIVASKEFLARIKPFEEKLAREVKAKELVLSTSAKLKGTETEWEIEEESVKIVVLKAN
ncbi:MAG: isoleucine--tRNA ligase [Candidatus Micrarchaeota archaeon]